MGLSAATRLGPYEILSPLGAGGMGEVYRARDLRLGREVAIKVLPAHLASDPIFRQRLEREARAVSSLSHAHICQLYDIGHHDGIDFLVMEYLDGETLAHRLERGSLPSDLVLRYGIEIADALHCAHRQGIVHRDLKPSNVMITRAGARLLDFGLATPAAATPLPATDSCMTVTPPLTADGNLVGTFQYISPEQVEGKPADGRSDIFALGAVLYEMATGRRAFDGKTAASVIAAVLEREPPQVSTLQPLSPPGLDHVVKECLAKDPEARWQSAHDVKLQLQALRASRGQPVDAGNAGRRGGHVMRWLALAALVAAAVLFARMGQDAAAPRLIRASLLPPAGHSFTPYDFAVSPDGRKVAFVGASADGISTLWIHTLDSAQPAEVSGSEGADSPFWSPDSRFIAFFAQGKLMKVEAGGLGLQALCDVPFHLRGGAWNKDDVLLIAAAPVGPLFRVPASGGTPQVLGGGARTPGEAHRFPQFLPDGRRFLYVASWTTEQRGGLYLASLDGAPPRLVSSEMRTRTLLARDHLLYLRGGTLYAQPFDTGRGDLTGTPQALIHNEITFDWRFGEVPFSASDNGVLVYQSRLEYNSRLVWCDRTGRELGTVGAPGYSAPALSPDGGRVAAAYDRTGSGQPNIWVYDLQRHIATQRTTEGIDTAVRWSPDGRWLAYSSIRRANGLYRRPADGSGKEETLLESPAHILLNDYSPDGRHILYMDFSTGVSVLNSYDLETRRSNALGPGAEASYSPDAAWIARVADRGSDVTIGPATGSGGVVQISGDSGAQARWRGDGKEVFYIGADRKMMSVALTTGHGVITAGPPEPLFQTHMSQSRLVLFQYDITRDGQRFLINSLPREDAAAPLTLVANWTELLRR